MEFLNPESHFSIRSILSVPALGAFLIVFLSVTLFVSHSEIPMKGGV